MEWLSSLLLLRTETNEGCESLSWSLWSFKSAVWVSETVHFLWGQFLSIWWVWIYKELTRLQQIKGQRQGAWPIWLTASMLWLLAGGSSRLTDLQRPHETLELSLTTVWAGVWAAGGDIQTRHISDQLWRLQTISSCCSDLMAFSLRNGG